MLAAENTEISSLCQQANRIAARLRGRAYVKPEPTARVKREQVPKTRAKRVMRPRPVTAAQQRVLDFMRRFLAENDQLPPYWAIAEAFGWASQASAQNAVYALAKKGLIERNAIGNWRLARVNIKEAVA